MINTSDKHFESQNAIAVAANAPGPRSDLETILAAWQTATDRLRETHETLRTEVGRLTDELEFKNRELARKNRLADLGQMASHIAHEVRNGLVPLTLYLSLLRRRLNDGREANILDKLDSGFTALEATVNDLLHFTSDREPQREWFDLGELVNSVCESLAPQLAAQRITVETDFVAGRPVLADKNMIRRAVLNLLLNALDVMPEGGELSIASWCNGNVVELEVADAGPGVPHDVRHRIFEPFYTTKNGGTGLGLAIVHHIADLHGGTVSACDCPQGGAAFTLRIPLPALEAAA